VSPKLKRLSGSDIVRILGLFGFSVVTQRGSHVKLRRIGNAGEKQTITIPLHSEIDIGTVKAIFRQASRYIPEDQLRRHFYT
jgi:predicted RNA binding protein YcfA (HicA-like mRNA interferase family)